jgi:hypothetical protein
VTYGPPSPSLSPAAVAGSAEVTAASARISGPVRFVFAEVFGAGPCKFPSSFPKWNFFTASGLVLMSEDRPMLVERGLQVMNVEVVGDAYAIEFNRLRLANKAIAKFEASELVRS